MDGDAGRVERRSKFQDEHRRRVSVSRDGVDPKGLMRYRVSKLDCDACLLTRRGRLDTPACKTLRSIHKGARDMACDIAKTDAVVTSRCGWTKVEMPFTHVKRILRLDGRLRRPCGAQDEFLLAATAQNRRKFAKLV